MPCRGQAIPAGQLRCAESPIHPARVETRSEREKLMFRIKLRADPAWLAAHRDLARGGLPGSPMSASMPMRRGRRRFRPAGSKLPWSAAGCPPERVSHRYGGVAGAGWHRPEPAGRLHGRPDRAGRRGQVVAAGAGFRGAADSRPAVEVLGGDIGERRFRASVQPRIAYMPQGLGRTCTRRCRCSRTLISSAGCSARPRRARARIDELLASTGLSPFRDRPAAKLSGGMKQKLGLCCALIHDPDLLILDEPTTGVDPLSRRQFWELIDSIRARRPGMSVLVATAYMEEAERFDWLVAMDDGKGDRHRHPAELRAQTGQTTLDGAFIQLLPEAPAAHHALVIRRAAMAVLTPSKPTACRSALAISRRSTASASKIEPGEIFGFLGSNGCGKTTTMKMLTGLLPPSEGSASLFGKGGRCADLETRKQVGYMSQAFSLYGELTVRQTSTCTPACSTCRSGNDRGPASPS